MKPHKPRHRPLFQKTSSASAASQVPVEGVVSTSRPSASIAVPRSTYRLQFQKAFTFEQATELVGYLDELGIGGVYASPVFAAKPGSVHGYDVVRHDIVNPEIGTEESFERFATSLSERGMALIMDVVPNHMCISGSDNPWWIDVLENGPASPYSKFFDIQWDPPKSDLQNKVLLPFLGAQYGRMLESKEIQLSYEDGRFFCRFYDSRLPVAPGSWTLILEPALTRLKDRMGDDNAAAMELESIVTALSHLPRRTDTDPEQVKTRYREKEIARRRISALHDSSGEFRLALEETIRILNGRAGDPRSFDLLETVLDAQTYRLCLWRVAADEINYRRFFDISDLAAIRVEEPEVFDAVHSLIIKFISSGLVTGLRIDHVDGLLEPARYLAQLQQKCLSALDGADLRRGGYWPRATAGRKPSDFHVVVEKILVGDERLRDEWRTSGTTGYDFLNDLNGLFVSPAARRRFHDLYQRFTGRTARFQEVLATCKKFIMLVGLSSELQVLTTILDRISEQHRWSRDFTKESLRFALREVIAYFPVYRSYISSENPGASEDDRRVIRTAILEAKRHNPATDPSIFDFIQSVLLQEHPEGLTGEQISHRVNFTLRFQQLTSPVMAKGMEDTAFYRYFPLASLNEVGGEPDRFGIPARQFHAKNSERRARWQHALLATATHDTKRGEDARARINVLSEIPVRWYRTIRRWQSWNASLKTEVDGRMAPDSNEEYLLYQTVAGTWPTGRMDAAAHESYVGRIEEYLHKAIKEAKQHTSWISPNESYEKAVSSFVRKVLSRRPENRFLADLQELLASVQTPGLLNGLSQVLLKIASPGVPDFYQGTELWDFNLVDPDNRRPVDYGLRRRLLRELAGVEGDRARCEELMARLPDGKAKLYIIKRGLELRRREERLLLEGDYSGLGVEGTRKGNVVAFSRSLEGKTVIAAAARFFLDLQLDRKNRTTRTSWGDTAVMLREGRPGDRYKDVLTGSVHKIRMDRGHGFIPAAALFEVFPVALLEKIS